jgi:hypothetical protein
MEPLDDYISGNMDRFNSDEPLDGHFERFDEKLTQLGRRRIAQPWTVLLKIAAVLILGLIISYAAFHEFNKLKISTLSSISGSAGPELNEAVQYYSTQLNISYNRIQNLRFNDDQNEKRQVLEELSEMDKQVQALEKDLKQNPDDERIVHAIINFYQVKIEMMDMIIARTEPFSHSIL